MRHVWAFLSLGLALLPAWVFVLVQFLAADAPGWVRGLMALAGVWVLGGAQIILLMMWVVFLVAIYTD